MFNSGYEMRSVTVTPLHNISSIFSNIFTFRLDKIGFSDEHFFVNYKNIALGYFGNACVYFELNKYVL